MANNLKISDIIRKKWLTAIYPYIAIVLFISGNLLFDNSGFAQSQKKYYTDLEDIPYDSISIDRIFIIGNKRTKERIIRRELDFTDGERIPTENLKVRIKKNEEKKL